MSDNERNARALDAIAVMTAWTSADDDGALLCGETAVNIVRDSGKPEAEAWTDLAVGLIEICGSLLLIREQESNQSIIETLRQLAPHHA